MSCISLRSKVLKMISNNDKQIHQVECETVIKKIGKRNKKKLHVEGIQIESGSQYTPTSEHSGLTIDEMENESTGSLSSIFS